MTHRICEELESSKRPKGFRLSHSETPPGESLLQSHYCFLRIYPRNSFSSSPSKPFPFSICVLDHMISSDEGTCWTLSHMQANSGSWWSGVPDFLVEPTLSKKKSSEILASFSYVGMLSNWYVPRVYLKARTMSMESICEGALSATLLFWRSLVSAPDEKLQVWRILGKNRGWGKYTFKLN